MKKEIKVKCPAKVNLTLEILNKREDGFHNIQSVMQTIDLFDILTIEVEESKNFEIKLSGTSDEIPYDEKNLVYKATELFMNALEPSPLVGEGGWKPDEGFKKILGQRTKKLRTEATTPEQILWFYLRDRRFAGLKFRRQVPFQKYIVDFVCLEKKLIIELDGSGHLQDEKIKYDKKRDDFFINQNFKILRFYNNELFDNLEGVLELIYINTNDDSYMQKLPCRENKADALEPPHPPFWHLLPQGAKGQRFIAPLTISIHIEKNIPIAAGLAGGSTDAAGTLWGLNKLFNNVLTNEEIHALCAKLGSDLNFCLEGGCQLTTGRGEILEPLPFQEFDLSLIKPQNLGISAKEAYIKFSQLEKKPNLDMTTKLVEALKSGNTKVENFLHNDLEVAIFHDYEELQKIKHAFATSIMSGSGSTYFILEERIENLSDDYWLKTNLKSIPYGVCEFI